MQSTHPFSGDYVRYTINGHSFPRLGYTANQEDKSIDIDSHTTFTPHNSPGNSWRRLWKLSINLNLARTHLALN